MSAVSRFAAAFGFKAKAADDKDDKPEDDKKARRAKARERNAEESDEDYAKRCAEEDEKDKAEDDKEKKKDPDDKDGKKGAQNDDEKCAAARAEGVIAERKRWETTLSDPRAADRGISACHMLAGTEMSASAILTTIASLPAQATQENEADGLARRMAAERAANPAPSPGAGSGQDGDNSPTAVAARINAAADMARGKTK